MSETGPVDPTKRGANVSSEHRKPIIPDKKGISEKPVQEPYQPDTETPAETDPILLEMIAKRDALKIQFDQAPDSGKTRLTFEITILQQKIEERRGQNLK